MPVDLKPRVHPWCERFPMGDTPSQSRSGMLGTRLVALGVRREGNTVEMRPFGDPGESGSKSRPRDRIVVFSWLFGFVLSLGAWWFVLSGLIG